MYEEDTDTGISPSLSYHINNFHHVLLKECSHSCSAVTLPLIADSEAVAETEALCEATEQPLMKKLSLFFSFFLEVHNLSNL